MLIWVGIAVLGALGAVWRFRVDSAVTARLPSDFPLGTFVVNLTGSFGLGVLVGAAAPNRVAFLLGVGFAGGYTTFSTWMVESVRLGEVANFFLLLQNLLLSMLLGFGVMAAGFYLGRGV